MKYKKYYDLIKTQSYLYDKTQNCNIGQTYNYHLKPVIDSALFLADKYGADKEIVELGAIFHDYADLLDINNQPQHHILGSKLAKEILLEDGFAPSFVEKVCKCVQNHRASVNMQKNSLEEICVADADAMSHLNSVVELIMWRGYLGEDILSANNYVKTKIKKSFDKMSPATKKIMQHKYDCIMEIMF